MLHCLINVLVSRRLFQNDMHRSVESHRITSTLSPVLYYEDGDQNCTSRSFSIHLLMSRSTIIDYITTILISITFSAPCISYLHIYYTYICNFTIKNDYYLLNVSQIPLAVMCILFAPNRH